MPRRQTVIHLPPTVPSSCRAGRVRALFSPPPAGGSPAAFLFCSPLWLRPEAFSWVICLVQAPPAPAPPRRVVLCVRALLLAFSENLKLITENLLLSSPPHCYFATRYLRTVVGDSLPVLERSKGLKRGISMKRLLLLLTCAIVLSTAAPLAASCLSGCFSKPQLVVYGHAAPSVCENLTRVPVDVLYRRSLPEVSG